MKGKIKVCDAIMGSGKSQSTITYINEHPDERYVYITPYLGEATRIKNGCPDAMFVEPSDELPEFAFSKLEHTRYLLCHGYNVATTHQAFRSYTVDMIESIEKYEYTLIIDEAVDVFQEASYSTGDVDLLVNGGYIVEDGDKFVCTGAEYTGERLKDLFDMLRCNNLFQVDRESKGKQYFYWAIPRDILNSFSSVYVLTYLFESQEFRYFLDINGFEYEYIGIRRTGDEYRFVDKPEYIPAYVRDLPNTLKVFQNDKLNAVGKNKNALSVNWLKKHTEERMVLKNNLYNFIRHYNVCKCPDVMWSTFQGNINALRGRGFSKQTVPFNQKATNEYRDRTVLGYCVNIFAQPQKVQFFAKYGIDYDEDGVALSTMIQWIWRSAIRDGNPVSVYVPSRRMRTILTDWIEEVSHCA